MYIIMVGEVDVIHYLCYTVVMSNNKHTIKVRVKRNNKLVLRYLIGNLLMGWLEWLSDLQVKLDKPISVKR